MSALPTMSIGSISAPRTSSTPKVQRHRRRKVVKEITDVTSVEHKWTIHALQQFYIGNEIPADRWISALDLFEGEITDEHLSVKCFYYSDWNEFLRLLNNPGIERTTLWSGTNDTLLIRPKFLKDDLNQ